MAKFTAPPSRKGPRIPTPSHKHGPLSARKKGDAHPVTEHKKGGHRMTGQSGRPLPMDCK